MARCLKAWLHHHDEIRQGMDDDVLDITANQIVGMGRALFAHDQHPHVG